MMRKKDIYINLLAAEMEKQRAHRQGRFMVVLALVVIYAGMACLGWVFYQERTRAYHDSDTLLREKGEQAELARQLQEVKSRQEKMERKADMIERLEARNIVWTEIMAGLEHNIPLQVYLTHLELAEDEIVLQGVAADSAAVASLVSGLTDDLRLLGPGVLRYQEAAGEGLYFEIIAEPRLRDKDGPK